MLETRSRLLAHNGPRERTISDTFDVYRTGDELFQLPFSVIGRRMAAHWHIRDLITPGRMTAKAELLP